MHLLPKRYYIFFVLICLAISCTNREEKITQQKAGSLVYYVSGITIPNREIVEKCKELNVQLKSEPCVMDSNFSKNNYRVDSIIKAKHGTTILEIIAKH